MKPTIPLAIAALAVPAAAQSFNIVDSLMRDLDLSFRALTSNHRRVFHRRIPGQPVKRCIPSSHGSPTGNSTSTLSTSSATATLSTGNSTNTRTSTGTSTRTSTGTSTRTATSTSSAATPSSTWKLQTSIAGSDFFNQWDFWSSEDPTHGAPHLHLPISFGLT